MNSRKGIVKLQGWCISAFKVCILEGLSVLFRNFGFNSLYDNGKMCLINVQE